MMADSAIPVIVGLGGSNHDGSAALLRGNTIEVAIEQERVSRRKHGVSWWWENPVGQAVDYCLTAASSSIEEVVRFVSSDLLPRRVIEAYCGTPVRLFPHHLCHAASACMMLPVGTRACVVVYDGMGSIRSKSPGPLPKNLRETFGFFRFDRDGLHVLGETLGESLFEHDDFPSGCSNSIGKLYDMVTTILGFDETESGKTMGLAAHGRPRYAAMIEEHLIFGDTFETCLTFDASNTALPDRLRALISGTPDFAVKADLAASIQATLEKVLVHASGLLADEEFDVLCIAGGCALNSVANGALAAKLAPGHRLLTPPHAGDAGLALGALWLDRAEDGSLPQLTMRGRVLEPWISRPGRLYGPDHCRDAARLYYPHLARDPSVNNAHAVAARLAEGAVIGVLNGASEFGPRALGGRSILADPRRALTRERINRRIKLREPFRPLAPMILEERCQDYFVDIRQTDPYMVRVARATALCEARAPAIVHVDGTARVQTVPTDGDPFLRALLLAFEELTDLPLLLNTSFNRRGEPIVETPEDALDAFVGMGLDGLYLDGLYFSHPNPAAIS